MPSVSGFKVFLMFATMPLLLDGFCPKAFHQYRLYDTTLIRGPPPPDGGVGAGGVGEGPGGVGEGPGAPLQKEHPPQRFAMSPGAQCRPRLLPPFRSASHQL